MHFSRESYQSMPCWFDGVGMRRHIFTAHARYSICCICMALCQHDTGLATHLHRPWSKVLDPISLNQPVNSHISPAGCFATRIPISPFRSFHLMKTISSNLRFWFCWNIDDWYMIRDLAMQWDSHTKASVICIVKGAGNIFFISLSSVVKLNRVSYFISRT